jgi:hypothetical protein
MHPLGKPQKIKSGDSGGQGLLALASWKISLSNIVHFHAKFVTVSLRILWSELGCP